MKIEETLRQRSSFRKLDCGDLFRYLGKTYIKALSSTYDGNRCVGVDLENGIIEDFCADDMVFPCANAVLKLNG